MITLSGFHCSTKYFVQFFNTQFVCHHFWIKQLQFLNMFERHIYVLKFLFSTFYRYFVALRVLFGLQKNNPLLAAIFQPLKVSETLNLVNMSCIFLNVSKTYLNTRDHFYKTKIQKKRILQL